jgi:hypothetical protein
VGLKPTSGLQEHHACVYGARNYAYFSSVSLCRTEVQCHSCSLQRLLAVSQVLYDVAACMGLQGVLSKMAQERVSSKQQNWAGGFTSALLHLVMAGQSAACAALYVRRYNLMHYV